MGEGLGQKPAAGRGESDTRGASRKGPRRGEPCRRGGARAPRPAWASPGASRSRSASGGCGSRLWRLAPGPASDNGWRRVAARACRRAVPRCGLPSVPSAPHRGDTGCVAGRGCHFLITDGGGGGWGPPPQLGHGNTAFLRGWEPSLIFRPGTCPLFVPEAPFPAAPLFCVAHTGNVQWQLSELVFLQQHQGAGSGQQVSCSLQLSQIRAVVVA